MDRVLVAPKTILSNKFKKSSRNCDKQKLKDEIQLSTYPLLSIYIYIILYKEGPNPSKRSSPLSHSVL